jgi:hypothetical protein
VQLNQEFIRILWTLEILNLKIAVVSHVAYKDDSAIILAKIAYTG